MEMEAYFLFSVYVHKSTVLVGADYDTGGFLKSRTHVNHVDCRMSGSVNAVAASFLINSWLPSVLGLEFRKSMTTQIMFCMDPRGVLGSAGSGIDIVGVKQNPIYVSNDAMLSLVSIPADQKVVGYRDSGEI
jgi:hypothetical protein